jgi:hypothetical protein
MELTGHTQHTNTIGNDMLTDAQLTILATYATGDTFAQLVADTVDYLADGMSFDDLLAILNR